MTRSDSPGRPAHRGYGTAARVRISGPAQLLQAVPYLLGFHPSRSLVLVGLDGCRLVVTARVDLDLLRESDLLARTFAALSRGGATSVIGAVYDDEADARITTAQDRPWAQLTMTVAEVAEAAGCPLTDALLVVAGRYWSLSCANDQCCPAEGRPVPEAPSSFAAAATYDGVVALPDRSALERTLDPLPDEDRARLDAAIGRAENSAVQASLAHQRGRHERSVKRALFAAARACAAPEWAGVSDEQAAEFAAALTATPMRDAVWLAVDDGRIDGRALWHDLARRLPSPYDAPPLFLYGWAAWRAGSGALAGIAAERALASDPYYTAADLLLGAVAHGLSPHKVPRLGARTSA